MAQKGHNKAPRLRSVGAGCLARFVTSTKVSTKALSPFSEKVIQFFLEILGALSGRLNGQASLRADDGPFGSQGSKSTPWLRAGPLCYPWGDEGRKTLLSHSLQNLGTLLNFQ